MENSRLRRGIRVRQSPHMVTLKLLHYQGGEFKGTSYFSKGGQVGQSYSPSAPSSLERFRSKVSNGRWPAFRAVSRIKQSENPNDTARVLRPRYRILES